METILEIDKALFVFFNAFFANSVFDVVMPWATKFSNWIIPGVILAAIFAYKKRKQAIPVFILIMLTIAINDSTGNIIKKATNRPRPCHENYYVEGGRYHKGNEYFSTGTCTSRRSFPSSHTSNMFALATLLTCFYRKRWPYFFAFATFIAYTRIYVGVHYPFDILAGAVYGSLIGFLIFRGYGVGVRVYENRKGKKDDRSHEVVQLTN